jgi:Domain of Unknown Function (DUF928)
MNLMQRLLWTAAGTIALVGLQISSRPIAPKVSQDASQIFDSTLFDKILSEQSASLFGGIPSAEAKAVRYVPPSRRGAPARTQGGGSRGCDLESVPVTLLAPPDHVGMTTEAHPKLFWYSAKDSILPMQISLVEPGVSEPLWVTQVPTGPAGFNYIQIPATVPDLVAGRRYRWTVTRLCNVRRPSNNTYARGWIERVASDPIAGAVKSLSITDRVNAYAEAGLWYNAVTEAVGNPQISDPDDRSLILSLLEQGGLTGIVLQEQKRLNRQAKVLPIGSSTLLPTVPSTKLPIRTLNPSQP